jgi:alkenylglycerophosphocholine/alkenylglycerophosphoethanolamine hydrolase
MGGVAPVVALFLISAATAVFGAETNRRWLVSIAKPLTTLLLFVVVGLPDTRFATLVDVGIAFSLFGDIALLGSARKIFLLGLVLFLVAHVFYIAAFVVVAATDRTGLAAGFTAPHTVTAAALVAIATALLLRQLLKTAGDMRAPVVAYAVVISMMVVSAFAALPVGAIGPDNALPSAPLAAGVAWSAAVGAGLFYVSDASLALHTFRKKIPHAPLLTLGVYWLGQLGIALAARAAF